MMKDLVTERLFLTPMSAKDGGFIFELVNTEGWLQFIGNRNILSEEDAVGYINKINQSKDFHYWIVHLRSTHVPLGVISFLKRDYLPYFDIGFAFLPQYNGEGYAYEAAKKILETMRLKPEHSIILATTLPHNVRSIKLLNRLGLQFSNELKLGSDQLHVYTTKVEEG